MSFQRLTYSDNAKSVIKKFEASPGAEDLIKEHRDTKKAVTASGRLGLFATEDIPMRSVVLAVFGNVSLPSEFKEGDVLYDGFGIDKLLTLTPTSDARFVRKLARKNSNVVLKHVVTKKRTIGIFIVAIKDLKKGEEIILPRDEKEALDVLRRMNPLQEIVHTCFPAPPTKLRSSRVTRPTTHKFCQCGL